MIDGDYSLCINGDGVDILQGRLRPAHAAGHRSHAPDAEVRGCRRSHVLRRRQPRHRPRTGAAHVDVATTSRRSSTCDRATCACASSTATPMTPSMSRVRASTRSSAWRRRRSCTCIPTSTVSGPPRARARVRAGRVIADTPEEYESAEQAAAAMIAEPRVRRRRVRPHASCRNDVDLPHGATYINSGNWLRDTTFVQIADDKASLLEWRDSGPVPL